MINKKIIDKNKKLAVDATPVILASLSPITGKTPNNKTANENKIQYKASINDN